MGENMGYNKYLSECGQETNINYTKEDDMAEVFTTALADIKKLDRLAFAHQDDIRIRQKADHTRTYLIPKKWIRIRPPKQYSEEEKQKLAERGKANLQKLREEKMKKI